MRLPLLFATAILTPVLLIATLLVPSYASIYAADYIVYMPENGTHPLAEKYLDIFHILETYQGLLNFWLATPNLDFVGQTLPIAGLPLLGCTLALYLTYGLSRRLINFFHLSASI